MFAPSGFHFMFASFLCVFFSGHRNNLPQMSQCTRQSNSSKFASFSCAVFVFVLPAAYFKLDMSNLSLFQVKIFNFSSLKKVGK